MTDETQSGNDDGGSTTPPENAEKPAKLTDLLDEWDASGKKPTEAKPEDIGDRLSAVERRLASDAYDKEMESVVGSLKGDLDVDDFIVEAWINKQADNDTRLRDLYTTRDENPGQWRKAISALRPEFEDFAKNRVLPASDDKGVSAAVRASKESPKLTGLEQEGDNYGDLSDSDFALKKAEVFRLTKAGKLT